MNDSKRISSVPGLDSNYLIEDTGNLFFAGDLVTPYTDESGVLVVDVLTVFGQATVNLAWLVLLSFECHELPSCYWNKIEPMFIDENNHNVNLENLCYRFSGDKLPVLGFDGYYHIPFNLRYAINEQGTLLNTSTGKTKVWSILPDKRGNKHKGYFYSRVPNDSEGSSMILKHRAMALVFKRYPANVKSLIVNHLNGDKQCCELYNLEWDTHQGNARHAIDTGLSGLNRPIRAWNIHTREETRYPSITHAEEAIPEVTRSQIRYRLDNHTTTLFEDGYYFKYQADVTPWPEIDVGGMVNTRGKAIDIMAHNVHSNQWVVCVGSLEAERYTGVPAQVVSRHVREKTLIPYNGWNFRKLEEVDNMPIHTERHLAIYRRYPTRTPNGVIVTDTINENEEFYLSASLAGKEFNLTNSRVVTLCNSPTLLYKGRYRFEYFKLEEELVRSMPLETKSMLVSELPEVPKAVNTTA